MKKFFGKHLLERNVISAENLAEALIEQMRRTPIAAEIALKGGTVNAEGLIKILDFQTSKAIDFFNAGKSLGLLDDDSAELVQRNVEKERTPLGEILLNLKLIRGDVLMSELDTYINDSGDGPELEQRAQPKEKYRSDEDAVSAELRSFITQQRLQKWTEQSGLLSNVQLAGLVKDVRGRAYLMKWRRICAILTGLEEVLGAPGQPEDEELRSTFADALSLIWHMYEATEEGVTEEEFL